MIKRVDKSIVDTVDNICRTSITRIVDANLKAQNKSSLI